MPVVHNNAVLPQIQQQLDQIQGQLDQMQGQLKQMQGQMNQQMNQMQQQIAAGNNNVARALNAHAKEQSPLTPLLNDAGQAVPGFPATRSALRRLPVAQLNAFLVGYTLPTNGMRADKQDRLLTHLGYRLPVTCATHHTPLAY
eukprot:jgi/Chrzof1/8103/UNPLg00148.t1